MEIALSSTESEYAGSSYASRKAIPVMEILKEMKQLGCPVHFCNTIVRCKVYEDNSWALEMANTPKFWLQTKHINVKMHHFYEYVECKEIVVILIDTKE